METKKIDGKQIAEEVLSELKKHPVPKKILAAVLVGNNPASISYLKQKEKIAKELKVDFRIYQSKENNEVTNDYLRREVGRIGQQKSVGGILVQLPLPGNINRHYVLNAIPREKDVDVLGERALGAYYTSRNPINPTVVGAVQRILNKVEFKIRGKKIAVIGLGFLVGRPIANWLSMHASDIYLLDKGFDSSILKYTDLIISCVGKADLVNPEMLKENAGVIDFGYSFENGKIKGDFNDEDKEELTKLQFYTPTPGGTGPIIVAELFSNFYKLNT